MVICCVNSCKYSIKRLRNDGISYFKFPKRGKLRDIWLQKGTFLADFKPNANSRICSEHFESNCLNNYIRFRRLKESAVPTLFNKKLPFQYKKITSLGRRTEKQRPKSKKILNNLSKPTPVDHQILRLKKLLSICKKRETKISQIENDIYFLKMHTIRSKLLLDFFERRTAQMNSKINE